MTVAPNWTTVREKAEELKSKILEKFPKKVDVEYVTWQQLTGSDHERWEHRGFPAGHPSVQAYVLIRGDLASGEKAAVLADNEVSRIWEEAGVTIQVAKTNHVYCVRSRPLVAYAPPALSTGKLYRKETGGVIFLCSWEGPHEHEWGRLKPKQSVGS